MFSDSVSNLKLRMRTELIGEQWYDVVTIYQGTSMSNVGNATEIALGVSDVGVLYRRAVSGTFSVWYRCQFV